MTTDQCYKCRFYIPQTNYLVGTGPYPDMRYDPDDPERFYTVSEACTHPKQEFYVHVVTGNCKLYQPRTQQVLGL